MARKRHLKSKQALEDEEDAKRADAIMERIVAGKEKLYSLEEMLEKIKERGIAISR